MVSRDISGLLFWFVSPLRSISCSEWIGNMNLRCSYASFARSTPNSGRERSSLVSGARQIWSFFEKQWKPIVFSLIFHWFSLIFHWFSKNHQIWLGPDTKVDRSRPLFGVVRANEVWDYCQNMFPVDWEHCGTMRELQNRFQAIFMIFQPIRIFLTKTNYF